MLSNCGVKVLLIDCDLSTNGATYFYEEKLSIKKNRITSFFDLIFNESLSKFKCVPINDNYDFIPSVTQITKKNTKTYTYKNDSKFSLYNELCQKYDVILFDCQSGYTDILKLILPYMDVSLMVMESDAISSAAIRSLYLKIGDIINEKKIYQVFNKASKEEYDIYSKVSGGTVFTNIETIMFDWKIRKAFSVSQIPDLENTSANYGAQIFNVCNILFPTESIRNKIKKFELTLALHACQEEESIIKEKIFSLKNDHRSQKGVLSKNIALILPLMCAILLCFTFLFGVQPDKDFKTIDLLIAPIILAIVTVIFSFINIYNTTKEKRDYEIEVNEYREELSGLLSEKKELQQRLEAMNDSPN